MFPENTYRWPAGTWEDAQHHWSSGRCKPKPQWDTTSHLSERPSSINQQTSAGKNVDKGDPLCSLGGNTDWCSHCKSIMETPQKIKNRSNIWPSHPTFGYLLKWNKNSNLKRQCTLTFTAASFTIAKIWKRTKCPSTDEWIKKAWYIYTMEC